jgi:hypothetical protein
VASSPAITEDDPSRVIPWNSGTESVADTAKDFWVPEENEEMILDRHETEIAWLLEESLYCTRVRGIDWNFIWKYASPMLKVHLRKTSPSDGDDQAERNRDDSVALGKLVRLHDFLVKLRFDVVRRDIRKRLLHNDCRLPMIDVVPKLRRATHPLRFVKQKQAMAKKHAAGTKR